MKINLVALTHTKKSAFESNPSDDTPMYQQFLFLPLGTCNNYNYYSFHYLGHFLHFFHALQKSIYRQCHLKKTKPTTSRKGKERICRYLCVVGFVQDHISNYERHRDCQFHVTDLLSTMHVNDF